MNLLQRFERNYQPEPNSGCWLWLGHLAKSGYGQFRMSSNPMDRAIGAHRAAYSLFCDGSIDGLLVCHRCDNRACVNPDHLFVGTHQDNANDASRKGRLRWSETRKTNAPKGERHHEAKLTWGDVIRIRSSKEPGTTLSARYGVTPTQICKIRKGKAWRVDGHAS
jgi:hypothetical protein